MRLGSLFAGIGGFDLAAHREGITAAFWSEIDDDCRTVLTRRFPDARPFGDISELDPDDLPDVDILTAGSPCQDFSIAGARAGLDGARSNLFWHFCRLIDALEPRGLRYAIWENVPGVFSSNDGKDFENVVAALAGADKPVRLKDGPRWHAGLAARGRRAVSWRVLDAQHFGLAQRRRRVFAVLALGGSAPERAIDVLLEPESLSGDPASSSEAREDVASAITASLGSGGPDDNRAQARHLVATSFAENQRGELRTSDRSPALCTGGGKPGSGYPAVLVRNREGKPGGGKGPLLSEEQSLTLATGNDQILFAPQTAGTLTASWGNNAGNPATGARDESVVAVSGYAVRRLTPTECERLQGFPDGWTDVDGASDSARYRQLGNAVAVPVVQFILRRITAVETP